MPSQFSSPTAPGSTRVILVRHGRSSFNQLQRYQGSSDSSVLTEAGYETARLVGLYLKNQAIDAIYTSPLKRAQQTVDAILEQLGSRFPKRLEVHPGLREIDMAAWEGRTFQEVQQAEPEAYRCWIERPQEFCLALPAGSTSSQGAVAVAVQSGYPVLDLYNRAQQFWQEVLPRHRGQTIVIASHGGTNRALISTALGLPPACFHRLQQSNCGISSLNFPAGGSEAHLHSLNLTQPIGETLPKLKEGKQGLRLLLLPSESSPSAATDLSNLLREATIDFSLASTSDSTQALIDLVLQHHPQTVQLQSQQQQFLPNWQRTIAARSNSAAPLLTGLVVAQLHDIQQILAETVGLAQPEKLQVQPGCLSILHYPRANHSVIQALNFA